jgi:hypothetical protein
MVSVHLLLSYSLFTRISPSLSSFPPYTRHSAAARPTGRERWDAWRLVSTPPSPLVPFLHIPKGPPTSVYNPLWPNPASSNACTSILKQSLFRWMHILRNLYFCERKYCSKKQYCVTAVTVDLHKTILAS